MKLLRLKNRKKKLKKSEQSLRDLWDTINWTNKHIVGIPEREEREREKGTERLFEEIAAKNFPNLMNNMTINI